MDATRRHRLYVLAGLTERKHGVAELQCPADCDPDEIVKAAERDDLEVAHGGNHETVKDAEGRVITQVPRHQRMNPNTCRSIIKALKAAVADLDNADPS